MATPEATAFVSYRGETCAVPLSATLTEALRLVEQAQPGLELADVTAKLLGPKYLKGSLSPALNPHVTLMAAGAQPGARLMLVASTTAEVADVRAARDLPGMASFEREEARSAARRRQTGMQAVTSSSAPPGDQPFANFQVLQVRPRSGTALTPSPAAAMELLQQLAGDAAIVAVMRQRGWRVGLLSEMPPEGKVGISAVCVLGYNVNRGQEISLRLRTDDYQGLRKYGRIRETLVHELAHMVFDEHDDNFKALNSELLREVSAHEERAGLAHSLAGPAFEGWHRDEEEEQRLAAVLAPPVGGAAVMRETALLSGLTLQQMAGRTALSAASAPGTPEPRSAREAAAQAAAMRALEADGFRRRRSQAQPPAQPRQHQQRKQSKE